VASLCSARGLTHSQYTSAGRRLTTRWHSRCPSLSAAALHGLMQHSPTASRRTYVARRRSRIARGFLGVVSSLKSLPGSCCLAITPGVMWFVFVVSLLWMVAAPFYGCVKGRSVERDNMQLRSIVLNTTGYMHSSRRTTPMGLPSFQHVARLPPASLRTVPLGSDHPLSTHLAMARRHKVYRPGLAF
jgi:hypothetical protein